MTVFRRRVVDPEGPVCLSDGSWIIVEMGRGCISHISADGTARREIAHTGRPNGTAVDAKESVWVAESQQAALLKVTMEGVVTAVSMGNYDLPFLWPNDLCFGPDGAIYLTDSGTVLSKIEGVQPPESVYDQEVDGRVFRVNPVTGACKLLDRGLRFTNGIAFGPAGEYLYVSETMTGNIYRYKTVDGQVSGQRELFANVMVKSPIQYGCMAGPDGMAFDIEGNLYVAVLVQGDITVLKPDGSVKARLKLEEGDFPTNVAFARPGERRMLVTEGSKNQLLMIEVPADGLPLYS